MGLSMKNKVFALALVVVGVLATGTFAADRHIRVGGNVALGYNTIGSVDEEIVLKKSESKTTDDKTEYIESLKGANGLNGFGFELGGSVDFPISNFISLRANVLMGYRMHSGDLSLVNTKKYYLRNLVTDNYSSPQVNTSAQNLGEHSFNQFDLDIPVLCRMILPTGDENGFYAEVGPVFNINLSTSTDDQLVKAENVNKFSMGLSVGVGRPLPFEKVPVDIDVHLTFGILSMTNDEKFTPTDITVRVGATYWFI